MQTVQLLGGADGRAAFLRAARRHVAPGGLLVAAIAHEIDTFDDEIHVPVPDLREVGGVVYASRPISVRAEGTGFVLERLRERVGTDGRHEVTEDRIRLDRLTADELEAEARAAGFEPGPRRDIEATDDHVGSEVAVLHG